jgi:predicted DNA-binding transcriptional regulator AlpA
MNLLRFEDLRAKRIVRTWTTLNNWIDARGFPPGRMIGRFRTWTEAEVLAWIEAQPTTRIPPRGYAKRNGGAS